MLEFLTKHLWKSKINSSYTRMKKIQPDILNLQRQFNLCSIIIQITDYDERNIAEISDLWKQNLRRK